MNLGFPLSEISTFSQRCTCNPMSIDIDVFVIFFVLPHLCLAEMGVRGDLTHRFG